jgi:hypothetical protein
MDFVGKMLKGTEPARCVDGRPDPKSPQGVQMLGGSLHPIAVTAIILNKNFDNDYIVKSLNELISAGHKLGVHWGAHKHEDKSDCGFADRLNYILQTAKNNEKEILKRLTEIYTANGIDASSLSKSYKYISGYSLDKIMVIGKDLIDLSIKNQAAFENLQGDHGEQTAFVNLKENTTLDTQSLNNQGKQAFNLDLWAAISQTQALNKTADVNLIRDLSLILYMATEMVLVEQKGKPSLPVILNK